MERANNRGDAVRDWRKMNRARKNKETGTKAKERAGSKKSAGKGAVTLRESADGTVGRSRERITASLLKSALTGNVNSARLLLSLADEAGQGEHSGPPGPKVSIANAWAAEPQWQGEKSEETAE